MDGVSRLLGVMLGWHYCTVADMVAFEAHAWHGSRGGWSAGVLCSIPVELPRSFSANAGKFAEEVGGE